MNPYLWNYQAEPERLAEMDQECFRIPWKFDSYLELSQQKIFQAYSWLTQKINELTKKKS